MQPEHRAQPGSQPGGWGSGQQYGQSSGQPAGQPAARAAGQPVGSSAGQGTAASAQQPPSVPPQIDPQTAGAGSVPTASSRMTVPGYPSGPAAPAEEKVDTGPLPSRETLRREARAASSRRGAGDADVERAGELLKSVANIFSQRVVGQEQLRRALVTALMSSGHILLESVPGLAKTTAAQTLASAVSGSFRRIQCTPDLMPNDIVGTQILNSSTGEMTTQLGPVHANIVLLDEINRSSAKTQSAMLEAMQERQTHPRPSEEADVLDRISNGTFDQPVTGRPISTDDVEWLQRAAERVYVDPVIKQYIVALINTSRGGGPRPVPGLDRQVRVGASPRGGIALMKVAQAVALQEGRTYVIPDDVRLLRHGVLRHRLVLTYDALADGVAPEAIIDAIFAAVPTP